MAGGDIETNLLERSRGTYQSPCKRDYPIFYFKEIDLNDSRKLSDNTYDYHLMSMGKVKVDSIDDNEEMQIMDEAFDILGFTNQEKTDVYRISAICMQMSRLEFTGMGEVASPKNLEAGETCNEILGFAESGEAMYDAFIKPKYKVGTEWVNKTQNVVAVTVGTGSIIKTIYGRLFRYLVEMCNSTLIDPTIK